MADKLNLAILITLWIKSNYDLKNNYVYSYNDEIDSGWSNTKIQKIAIVDDKKTKMMLLMLTYDHYAMVFDVVKDPVLLDARRPDFLKKIYKFLTPHLAIEFGVMPNERS